jgi:hypothetical protein
MTAPIDIECPACWATAGNYCTAPTDRDATARLWFHHAERVDAAFRQTARRQDDPHALREALREVITRLARRQDLDNETLSLIVTYRELFDL